MSLSASAAQILTIINQMLSVAWNRVWSHGGNLPRGAGFPLVGRIIMKLTLPRAHRMDGGFSFEKLYSSPWLSSCLARWRLQRPVRRNTSNVRDLWRCSVTRAFLGSQAVHSASGSHIARRRSVCAKTSRNAPGHFEHSERRPSTGINDFAPVFCGPAQRQVQRTPDRELQTEDVAFVKVNQIPQQHVRSRQ